MGRGGHGWTKSGSGSNPDIYSEGIYYKSNQALILKDADEGGYNVVQRNTWTGNEKVIGNSPYATKDEARRFMQRFMRKYPKGTMPKKVRV